MNRRAIEDEAKRASALLQGKVVSSVLRHRPNELVVQFSDGTRLFVETPAEALELSITGGGESGE